MLVIQVFEFGVYKRNLQVIVVSAHKGFTLIQEKSQDVINPDGVPEPGSFCLSALAYLGQGLFSHNCVIFQGSKWSQQERRKAEGRMNLSQLRQLP